MQFPKLPTDSLYKFICVAGLITFVSSGLVGLWLNMTLYSSIRPLESEGCTAEIEKKYLEEDIKEQLGLDWKNIPISKLTAGQKDIAKEIEMRSAQIDNILSYLNHLKKMNNLQTFLSAFLAIAGTIVFLMGALLWYSRLQRYQDQLIRNASITPRSTTAKGEKQGNESAQ